MRIKPQWDRLHGQKPRWPAEPDQHSNCFNYKVDAILINIGVTEPPFISSTEGVCDNLRWFPRKMFASWLYNLRLSVVLSTHVRTKEINK